MVLKEGINMRRIYKGQFEYIKKRKLQLGLLSVGCFLLVFALLITGYISTGTKENLLTMVAILGVLPAAKFAATFFIIFPHHSQTKEDFDLVQQNCGDAIFYTDVLFSTEKKVLPTDFVVIRGGNVCGYASQPKYDTIFAQEYLGNMLKKNGVKANIKIFTDKTRFLRRIQEIAALEVEEKQEVRDERTAQLLLTLIM